MKMLAEERRMLHFIVALSPKENHRTLRKTFREAVKAVREDAAKKVERGVRNTVNGDEVAATIRRK